MESNSKLSVVAMTPQDAYLVAELEKRFDVLRLWEVPMDSRPEVLRGVAGRARAAVISPLEAVGAALLNALPRMEVAASFSVGLDAVDLEEFRRRGVRVTNTPGVLTEDVADLAIALALAVLRRVPASDRFVRAGAWAAGNNMPLGTKFSGKTIGILGLGRIGMAIAKRAEAFGCTIAYHSRTEKPDTGYKYHPTVVDLASGCQVLVVACSLTAETRHSVGRAAMDALGPGGALVNIARGPIVDEEELVAALRDGRLGGAGLDVFEREPAVPEELMGMDNAVLLPHVGSGTRETRRAMADVVLANLDAFAAGEPLVTPVF